MHFIGVICRNLDSIVVVSLCLKISPEYREAVSYNQPADVCIMKVHGCPE